MPELTNRQLSEAVLSIRKEIGVLSGKADALEAALAKLLIEKEVDTAALAADIGKLRARLYKLDGVDR